MAKRKNLSIELRASVVTLNKENYSCRAIAKKLKVSYCAVHEILKKVKETGSVRYRERSGRPRFTTPRQVVICTQLEALRFSMLDEFQSVA